MTKPRTLKINTYAVTMRAVEEGIGVGLNRAFKYSDEPLTPDNIHDRLGDSLRNEIATALCEVIDFDHDS